jgi:O-antigen/teichoic acid export membrane protein
VLSLATSSYATFAAGLATAPLVARALNPEGRGQVAAVITFSGLLLTLVSFGMPLALGHAVGTGQASSVQARRAGSIYAFASAPVALIVAGAILVGPLRDLQGAPRLAAIGLLLMTPLAVAATCWSGIFLAEGQLRFLTRLRLAPLAFMTCAVVTLFLFGRLTVASYVVATLLSGLAGFFATVHYLPSGPAERVAWLPLLSYGSRATVGTLAGSLTTRIDQALLAGLTSATNLGLYATAVTLSSLPMGLALAISARSFGLVASREGEERAAEVAKYLRLTFIGAVIFAAAIAAIAPVAVPLAFGRDFVGAIPVLYVLLFAVLFLSVTQTAGSCLTAVGRPGRNSLGDLAGVVITAALLPLALTTGSLPLVAAVSLLAYATVAVIQIVLLRRAVGPFSLVPRGSDFVDLCHRVAFVRRARSMKPGLRHSGRSGTRNDKNKADL